MTESIEPGHRNDEGGIILTDRERIALAYVLVADLADPERIGSVEWEDVPELAESEFERLESAIEAVRQELRSRALATGEDPQFVWDGVR